MTNSILATYIEGLQKAATIVRETKYHKEQPGMNDRQLDESDYRRIFAEAIEEEINMVKFRGEPHA